MTAGTASIGFVGLGAMGGRMVRRLLAAGYTVAVHDVRREAIGELVSVGAVACESARRVADLAEIVLVSLPTPDVVREVASGNDGLAGGDAIHTYVDLSTTGPPVAEEVARALTVRGIRCLDAPVSGGPRGAEAGSLTIMAAGPEEVVAEVRPLLEVLGSTVFVVGAVPGQGQVAKVVNNLLSASAIAITGEAVAVGVKAGLDPAVLLAVVSASSGSNTAASDKFPNQVLTRRFDHGFRLKLMAKDVALCLAEAERREVPMHLGSAVGKLWSLAAAEAADEDDCTTIVRLFESWSGTTISAEHSL